MKRHKIGEVFNFIEIHVNIIISEISHTSIALHPSEPYLCWDKKHKIYDNTQQLSEESINNKITFDAGS